MGPMPKIQSKKPTNYRDDFNIKCILICLCLLVFLFSNNMARAGQTSQKTFSDISKHWAREGILTLENLGIIQGLAPSGGTGKIYPDQPITRAEFIAVISKAFDLKKNTGPKNTFVDLKEESWYTDPMTLAFRNGLIHGYPDAKIRPEAPLTRAELTEIIVRANHWEASSIKTNLPLYKDVLAKDWFYKSIALCTEKGLIKGVGDKLFKPYSPATRAEAFILVYNSIKDKKSLLALPTQENFQSSPKISTASQEKRISGALALPDSKALSSESSQAYTQDPDPLSSPVYIQESKALPGAILSPKTTPTPSPVYPPKRPPSPRTISTQESTPLPGIEEALSSFSNISMGNYSIGFQDLQSPNRSVRNDVDMASASIIKVFIMAEAYNQVKLGKLGLKDKITIQNLDKVGGSGTLQGMKAPFSKTLEELITLMIQVSDNTASNVLIDILGLENINLTARKIGATHTVLENKFMISTDNKVHNFTSVSDLLQIYSKIYQGSCVSTEYDKAMLEILKLQKNNVKIPAKLPLGTVVAHKTGETESIENDAGIIFTPQGDFLLCIMTNDNRGWKAQQNDISTVSKKIFDIFLTQKAKTNLAAKTAPSVESQTELKTEAKTAPSLEPKVEPKIAPTQEPKIDAKREQATETKTDPIAFTKNNPLQGIVICVDPGHQSKSDTQRELRAPAATETNIKISLGTQGVSTKIMEYALNLEVALKLKKSLEALGAKVVMTRETNDVDISNVSRSIIANNAGAKAMIRIHADAISNSSLYGYSVLYPGKQYFKDKKIPDESHKLADLMNKEFVKTVPGKSRGLFERNDLAGLNWSLQASIILEMGFMTNPDEDKLLNSSQHQSKIVQAISDSLVEYFKK